MQYLTDITVNNLSADIVDADDQSEGESSAV